MEGVLEVSQASVAWPAVEQAGKPQTPTPPRRRHRHNRQLKWHTTGPGKAMGWQLGGSHGE